MRFGVVLLFLLSFIKADVPRKQVQVVCLLPFAPVTAAQVHAVERAITSFYHLPVAVLPTEKLPASAICPVRKRYRAQGILDQMAAQFIAPPDTQTKLLALTTADIELEAPPAKPHWGVFGLANRVGGDQCVLSTFRMAGQTDRLIKVSLHELGHTLHLPHCTSNTPACFMNDAKGKVATVDAAAVFLCDLCRTKLRW